MTSCLVQTSLYPPYTFPQFPHALKKLLAHPAPVLYSSKRLRLHSESLLCRLKKYVHWLTNEDVWQTRGWVWRRSKMRRLCHIQPCMLTRWHHYQWYMTAISAMLHPDVLYTRFLLLGDGEVAELQCEGGGSSRCLSIRVHSCCIGAELMGFRWDWIWIGCLVKL